MREHAIDQFDRRKFRRGLETRVSVHAADGAEESHKPDGECVNRPSDGLVPDGDLWE